MAKDSGVVNIHGKAYSTVAKRVQDFRETYKLEYSIETELVERTSEDVVMKATIRDMDGHIVASGYAEEKRAASTINKTSALENCETSAIGRALAAFGMAGTEYASADEVAQAISNQKAISAPRISPEKYNLILKAGKEKGLSEKALEARINALQNDDEADAAIQSLLLLGRD